MNGVLGRVPERMTGDEETVQVDLSPYGAFPEWMRSMLEALPLASLARDAAAACLEGPLERYAGDDGFASAFRSVSADNVAGFGRYLRDPSDAGRHLSPGWADFAAVGAVLRIQETDLQEASRVGARVLLDHWIAEVGKRAARQDAGVDVQEAVDGIRIFTHAVLSWQDALLSTVAATLAAEQETRRATGVSVRLELLRRVVAGDEEFDEAELSSSLLYDMSTDHCALLLPDCSERRARELTQTVRAEVGVSAFLTLPTGTGSTAVWLGRVTDWSARDRATLGSLLHRSETRASIGRPGRGLEGFLRSLRDAQRAEDVRGLWGMAVPGVLNFEDVALEALMLSDPAATRSFVASELRALAANTGEAEKLRRTVLVWFESGRHASAAATLGIHEHTVRNRVRRVEELVGHPLSTRRTELQVALRLYPALPDDPTTD